jgi:hypothetical protein
MKSGSALLTTLLGVVAVVLDSADGSMTLMIANSGGAFVLFGNCTAL